MQIYADETSIKIKNFVTKTDMALGKVRDMIDDISKNTDTFKFDIDKLMSSNTKLIESSARQESEITELQKELAVV